MIDHFADFYRKRYYLNNNVTNGDESLRERSTIIKFQTYTAKAHARSTNVNKHVLVVHNNQISWNTLGITRNQAVSPLLRRGNGAEVGSKKNASTLL